MRKNFTIFYLLLFSGILSLTAQTKTIRLTFDPADYSVEYDSTGLGVIRYSGAGLTDHLLADRKQPALCYDGKRMLMPRNSRLGHVNYKTSDPELFQNGVTLASNFGSDFTWGELPGREVLYSPGTYPNQTVISDEQDNLLDYHVATFLICPFIYDSKSKALHFIREVELSIEYSSSAPFTCYYGNTERIKSVVCNPEDLNWMYPEVECTGGLFREVFGTYKIESKATGKSIMENAGNLSSAPFSGLSGQSWTFTRVGKDYNISVNNKMLTANDSNLALSQANGSDSQLWEVLKLESGASFIRSKVSGKMLTLSGSGLRLETMPIDSAYGDTHKWRISHTELYLVGSATPGGWDLNKMISMKSDSCDLFTWSGYLTPGEFKFNPLKSSWAQALNSDVGYPTSMLPGWNNLHFNTNYKDDAKFTIQKAGYYKISVDLNNFYSGKPSMSLEESPEVYYVVGSATNKGWDNLNAEAMTFTGEKGCYTWTGTLKAGELKFLSRLNSWNYGIWATFPNELVVLRYPHSILPGSNAPDNKFIVQTAGDYTIELNTEKKTMIVRPHLWRGEPIYLIGDATPAGWNNTQAIEMNETTKYGGTYFWNGYLKPGHFKFITKLGTWNSLVPTRAANEPVICGYGHGISPQYRGDYRFVIDKAGHYMITVDLEDGKMQVSEVWESEGNALRNGPVYLIGDATPAGWDNKKAIAMNETYYGGSSSGIYTWTGTLKSGHFKFITQLGTWNSLVPVPASNEAVAIGTVYGITNDYRGDYRFVMPLGGAYTITLNIWERTMTVSPALRSATGIESIQPEVPFTVTSRDGSVEVVLNKGTESNAISLFNLQGGLFDRHPGGSGNITLGCNLAPGTYVVTIQAGDKFYSRKVVVR